MLYLKLIRANNWIKNLFILLPLFFSGELFNLTKLSNTILVIIGFSLVTSFVYIINDIFDINFDKNHQEKRFRPIASGRISIKKSVVIGSLLLFIGFSVLLLCSWNAFLISIIYVGLNLLYSAKLKHVSVIDFVIVAVGFVLRILIGGEVGDVELTQWMTIMVFLLCLFIAITKRRHDVYQYEFNEQVNRKVVTKYTVEFMDKLLSINSSTLLVAYLLFITSEDVLTRYPSKYLMLTFLFVLIGVFRYNQITSVDNKGSSPLKILFEDIFLQITLFLWLVTFFFIIY
jgi:4-hydroxybenzoate polyprenyltransferase|tara:strand:+ start:1571 stop:2431 length:861 start_codon:yes stop_codon:yes gene_type:complete